MKQLVVIQSDALEFLKTEPAEKYDMIYVDPPFGTGDKQVSSRDKTLRYDDPSSDDSYEESVGMWLYQARRVLKETGSIYVHLDYHSLFLVKPLMDSVFGGKNFLNHIVWAYNFGGRGKNHFPRKHDDILFYAKETKKHVFNWDDIDRVPYKAPEMQYVNRTKEDAESRIAAGQVVTDVWEMSIVGTNAKERTGYPTQKPTKLVERAIKATAPVNGIVLDFFAGSGTSGQAALNTSRQCILVDSNPQAIDVMKKRFAEQDVEWR